MKQLDLFKDDDDLFIEECENFISELENTIEELEEQERFFAENQAFEWDKEFPQCCDERGNWLGFDAVIGNPPYISAVNMARNKWQKEYFKNFYSEATGAYDIFILFLKRAKDLVKQNGFYAWIIPNKFLAAQYAQNTKNLLLNSGLYLSVDISHIRVFEKASVYPIMIFGKNKSEKQEFKEYKSETETDLKENKLIEYSKSKEYKTFKESGIKIMSGATGFEAQKLKLLISEKQIKGSIPFIVSGCIDKYSIDYTNVRYMGSLFPKAFIQNTKKTIAETKWKFWNNKKIVVAGMTKVIEAIWSEKPLAIGVGTYGIYDFGNFDPKFLLAILNSSFLSNYVVNKFRDKHLAGGYLAINKNMIEQFPIVEVDNQQQQPILNLVTEILDLKKNNPQANIEKLEKQIDKEVYKLYNLSKEEIKIVENETA